MANVYHSISMSMFARNATTEAAIENSLHHYIEKWLAFFVYPNLIIYEILLNWHGENSIAKLNTYFSYDLLLYRR